MTDTGKNAKRASSRTVTLAIKNMVCGRCIRVVHEELEKMGFDVRSVVLGEAVVAPSKGKVDRERIRSVLRRNGFDLIDDKRRQIIEKVKNTIITLVHHPEDSQEEPEKYSDAIARRMGMEYHYLSSLFSSIENITIEKYIILQKIERVKELLKYDELTLSEIAYSMGYSSVAHLSAQFKKVTGMAATEYKKLKEADRKSLDTVGRASPGTSSRKQSPRK